MQEVGLVLNTNQRCWVFPSDVEMFSGSEGVPWEGLCSDPSDHLLHVLLRMDSQIRLKGAASEDRDVRSQYHRSLNETRESNTELERQFST